MTDPTSNPAGQLLASFSRRLIATPAYPVALVMRKGAEQVFTLSDIDRLAGQIAQTAPSASPGRLFGLQVENGPLFLAALVAAWRRGEAPILLDRGMPEAAMLPLLNDMGARYYFQAVGNKRDVAVGTWREAGSSERPVDSQLDIAAVKLTSGSSGSPRGILTSHPSLARDEAALWSTMRLRDGERIAVATPLAHSYALSSVAIPALVRDVTLLFPAEHHPWSIPRAVEHGRATFLPTVPAWLRAVCQSSHDTGWAGSLRLVISAGSPLDIETSKRFRERFCLDVHSFYGASEAGGIGYDRAGGAAERRTVGSPVDGVEIELEPVPGDDASNGDVSSITVRSSAVAFGYHPTPSPALVAGRFRTSDLGTWQAGELCLMGRLDDAINIKGKKIWPREVENVLRFLPGVTEVAVVPVAVSNRGETLLRAVIASHDRPEIAEVLRHCRAHLSDHKIPRAFVFVERLPRNERGKVDREALLRLQTDS